MDQEKEVKMISLGQSAAKSLLSGTEQLIHNQSLPFQENCCPVALLGRGGIVDALVMKMRSVSWQGLTRKDRFQVSHAPEPCG